MAAPWFNTIGLLLGIVGVAILFIWGPPQPDLDPHIKMVLEKQDDFTKRLRRRHEIMSRVGLGLVGLGFLVQLIAVWLPTSPQ